ncbi:MULTISPECIES: hypothetical protein [Weeksellaceae]|uniref:Uncharacterized protein n=3 Tax=Weeksellaceae TaxID=2762318 RepID=A0A7Z7LSK5_9FLAO|nr:MULTISPECIES: hypothetical protein [Weeksellaceae]AZB32453.1 hypothetical protein EG351_01565 [Chryseobacterium bernardetii]EFK34666.1 hypothetical protein HMPREF0204_13735 [Chryseobacterium gleum ATCC 35910]MCT3807944.1 hypothetical protein [Elizabethkingia anophelis]MCT3825870.1 hypothetical protein [Elizabethkingia anophelis]MCT3836704.1 hypothetical protein [Elizabethkingia anophelis]|eukprot:gene3147-3600_t
MRKIKSIGMALVVAITTLAVSPVMAQSGHGSAPHGGKMIDVDNYHIEMVKGNNMLTFYVLDANAKTLNKPATGSVEFAFTDGKKTDAKLTPSKTGGLQAALSRNIHENVTVTIKVNGTTLTGKFKNEVSAAEKAHGHQH